MREIAPAPSCVPASAMDLARRDHLFKAARYLERTRPAASSDSSAAGDAAALAWTTQWSDAFDNLCLDLGYVLFILAWAQVTNKVHRTAADSQELHSEHVEAAWAAANEIIAARYAEPGVHRDRALNMIPTGFFPTQKPKIKVFGYARRTSFDDIC